MNNKSQMLIDRIDNVVVTCSVGAFSADDLTPIADALSSGDVGYYVAGAAGDVDLDPQARNMLFDLLRKKGIKVVAVTDSKVVKGIITAATWMGVAIENRSWSELAAADAPDAVLAPTTIAMLLRQRQICQAQGQRLSHSK
jgi:hypothetical protein